MAMIYLFFWVIQIDIIILVICPFSFNYFYYFDSCYSDHYSYYSDHLLHL